MKTHLILVPVALIVVGGLAIAAEPADPSPDSRYNADNTGRNVRDRESGARTADQQSNKPDDVRITREIRGAVVGDDSLSTNAHNVKIVTVDGVVTLRGPVKSADERTRVASLAEHVSGVKKINNQLEVAKR